MADGLCTEDTVGNQFEKTLVKDYTNIVKCVNKSSVNDTACENVKSFYIDSDSGKLCGKLCGVKGLDAKHEGFLDMPCSPGDEDCRKKRCADRYDSSESSDSGVAVLSCTDCSTYSGGSTGSSASDITEPGSPFSTASSHSEDSSSQPQPPRSAPAHTVHHPPWPWNSTASSTPNPSSPPALKRLTAAAPATPGGKRQRTDNNTLPPAALTAATPTANNNKKQVSNNNNTKRFSDAAAAVSFVMGGKIQQGKITEYFKAQMKTTSAGGNAKAAAQPPQGYFTLLDGPKVILGSRCAKLPTDLYGKLDVRSVTVTASPMKKVVLDTKTKKISQVIAVPRSAARGKADVVAYLHNHNLNLKVSSTVVPIVKLNNMPSKLNGSNGNHNVTSLSVETALPTVPAAVAKPKPAPQPLVPPPKKSPPPSPLTPLSTLPTPPLADSSGGIGGGGGGNSTKLEASTPGDSDSGVSVRDALTISVGATATALAPDAEPQKSPILSQPKTIRFPAKQTQVQRTDPADSGLCRWAECQAQFDTSGALLEHLQIKHVISQATQEHYVCLWVGCKVHGRTSCSRSWLERHVLGHAGSKPFRCIVDGCGYRFSSQQALEKHVNSHFNASENGSNGSTRKSLESGTTKLFKRNGKKLRYRRQPWSARMFDFFDAGIMEGLQHRLVTMTAQRTAGEACNKAPGDAVTLHSQVMARRVEPDGSRKVLLRWHPPDLVPDEWVLESDSTRTRTVSIPTLQPSAMDSLRSTLFPPQISSSAPPTQKHRRKRVSIATSS